MVRNLRREARGAHSRGDRVFASRVRLESERMMKPLLRQASACEAERCPRTGNRPTRTRRLVRRSRARSPSRRSAEDDLSPRALRRRLW
jgi:hypothetical protein